MLTSRLATQVSLIFFAAIGTIVGLIGWQQYHELAHTLPQEIQDEALRDTELIAASISDRVLYQQLYPLWSQLNKLKANFGKQSEYRIVEFAAVDAHNHLLTHSDPSHHPLMHSLDLGDSGATRLGNRLRIVVPILHNSSTRRLGTLMITFDISYIDQRIAAEQKKIIRYLLVALLLSLLLALGIRLRVAHPLRALTDLMPLVGKGAINTQAFQSAPLEVRQLAESIAAVDQALVEASKQAKQLAEVIEQAEEIVILTDIEGTILYVNPTFERVSGFSRDEAIGQTPRIVKSGEHDRAYYRHMWETLLAGKSWRDDFKNRKKDGSIYEVTQTITPLRDEHNEIVGFAAVQRDVTQQRKIDKKLQHADRVDSLGVLAGGIAHDFNNLLTSILGNAALAAKKLNEHDPAYKYLHHIESASMSAADLCRQMLAYSGKGKFVVQPVCLNELIDGMSKLIEVSIAKNIVMRYQLAKSLPMIDADIAQIQQVALNLLTNASEAIGDNSGVISLCTGVMHADRNYLRGSIGDDHLEEGRYVYLEVSDTGCGMDEETQKRIFDPFFTTKFTGRGLGMSAILGIIKGHHGAMRIYSEVGQGTSFRVLFPESQSQQWQQEESKAIALETSGTVLIVDDEETLREVAAAMLEDMGFATLKATNGVEGVQRYREHQDQIAFVLLDMTMPKMNGEECFRQLRQINPDVRVILSSGYSEEEATARFAGKGLAGFIQKPYNPQQLAEVIASHQRNDHG